MFVHDEYLVRLPASCVGRLIVFMQNFGSCLMGRNISPDTSGISMRLLVHLVLKTTSDVRVASAPKLENIMPTAVSQLSYLKLM